MTSGSGNSATSSRKRAVGRTAQIVGVVGIVVCLLLAVGVLLARGWAVDRVDAIASRVDAGIAKGIPLLETASARVGEVSDRVGGVVDAAEARAADPGPATDLVQGLLEKGQAASERYLAMRATYAEARESVVSALDRLNTIDRLVPAFSVPEGPIEALAALDARIREIDAALLEIFAAIPDGDSIQVAATIADKAAKVETALDNVSTGLADATGRLEALRAEVASWADTANMIITILSLVLVLAFLYGAVLHWVLYRSGTSMHTEAEGG